MMYTVRACNINIYYIVQHACMYPYDWRPQPCTIATQLLYDDDFLFIYFFLNILCVAAAAGHSDVCVRSGGDL